MGVKAGAEDEHVERVQALVPGAHARRLDTLDGRGHELGRRLLERGIERIGHDQALARHLVVGRESSLELGILHGVVEIGLTGLLEAGHLALVADHGAGEGGCPAPRDGLVELLHELGRAAEIGLLLVRVGGVRERQDPLRGALEERQLGNLVDDRRHDLDRRRAAADDADPPALPCHPVVPARGVEASAGEVLEAFDIRVTGVAQDAARGDDEIDAVGGAGLGLEPPLAAKVLGLRDLLVEPDEALDAVGLRHVLEIGLNLGPRREQMAPLRIGLEGVAVEMGGDIAGQAGVGVVAPRAAEAIGLLVDGEVVEARLQQLDRGQDARHPGAYDGEAEARVRLRRRAPERRRAARRHGVPRCLREFARTGSNPKAPGGRGHPGPATSTAEGWPRPTWALTMRSRRDRISWVLERYRFRVADRERAWSARKPSSEGGFW